MMKRIKLFYNTLCSDCAKLAMQTEKLDWFQQIDISTDIPPTGNLPKGEIAVLHYASNKYYTGAYATRKVCMYVPVYFLYGLLLYIPIIKNILNKNKHGCNGIYCEVKN
jgi:hypothetical protein